MKRVFMSSVGLLWVAGAFVLFNGMSGWGLKNMQLDLTDDQLYTLSPGTQTLLSELDEPIELFFFYSKQAARELPQVRQYAQRVEELLHTYVRLADGNIHLQSIDPEPFSEQEDQAAELGIQAVTLPQGDSLYFGLAGKNGQGTVQSIAVFALDGEAFLEYTLSRLVHTLGQAQRPVVGLMSGLALDGGFDVRSGQATPAWLVLDEVRQQFEVESVPERADEIPAHLQVLWLVQPHNLSEPTRYALDQFVLRGGKLLVFVDPFNEADPGLMTQDAMTAPLAELFEAWGVRLQPATFVADTQYAMSVAVNEQQRAVPHVGWLNIPAAGLSADDVVTAHLRSVTLAGAGILEPLAQATTTFTPLISSSDAAMPLSVNRLIGLNNPLELLADMAPTGARYTLAARISGPASTAFPEGLEGQMPAVQQAEDIQVLIVADTDILTDRMWAQAQWSHGQRVAQPWADNGHFTVNALDHLLGSNALISVRSRGQFSRPFTVVERLRRHAEERYREQEQALQQRLAEAEQQLARPSDSDATQWQASAEELASAQHLAQEKLAIRKQLRDVSYQLNADINSLGTTVKLFNIVVMPAILTFVLVLVGLQRRIKRMHVEPPTL